MDPIQRAGIRLLASAAIPIQTEVRRFLAQRRAIHRMWALIVVQAYLRRWLCQSRLDAILYSATLIQAAYRGHMERMYCLRIRSAVAVQAAFRGWLARDTLDDEHFCASQIQRVLRGYLASVRVYEDLYNVTVVQAAARGWLARCRAAERRAAIIIVQSGWQRYLAQCTAVARSLVLHHQTTQVIRIQSAWRSYSAQLRYQFDIVDVIIAQSAVRRLLAFRVRVRLRHEREIRSAIRIQKQWRTYDCMMNYLHAMADIIIMQSLVRRWTACRLYRRMRREKAVTAAVVIQKQWRAYDCTMNYLHTVADILIVQSMVRRKIAGRFLPKLRSKRHYHAAVEIQKVWRSFYTWQSLQRTLGAMAIQSAWRAAMNRSILREMRKQRAAIHIQRLWRGFQCYTDFIFLIADLLAVQRVSRRWLACRRVRALRERFAATSIQRYWRGYHAQMRMLYTLVHIIVTQVSFSPLATLSESVDSPQPLLLFRDIVPWSDMALSATISICAERGTPQACS